MIGKRPPRLTEQAQEKLKGFDDFELKLGDTMRGERATMGKSLLDVQRELKIKAAYIAAIENSDPTAFDTPGFIAGYVRSYARYLGMDPDQTFEIFCAESGFSTAHGMAPEASVRKSETRPVKSAGNDPFAAPRMPFVPSGESVMARIEPGAIGSTLVLLLVAGAIGFGGWSVLKEVQRVQIAPVDQTPSVVAEIDPLSAGAGPEAGLTADASEVFAPTAEALDRLYRPQALDTPVLVSRDAPIVTLDPSTTGVFAAAANPPAAPELPATGDAITGAIGEALQLADADPQVVEEPVPDVVLFAIRPVWVRVRSASGSVLFEKILNAGEEYVLPAAEEPPVLRAGNSGSLFFKVNGEVFGPAGPGTSVAKNVALSVNALKETYALADPAQDSELARIIALAEASQEAAADPTAAVQD